ncbi:MAG: hypothetical protein ABIJ65_04490 [Chloroflexota bacterium]
MLEPQHNKTVFLLTLLTLSISSLACQAITGLRGTEEKLVPVCTPPACRAGEEYYCAGECPGGCGTTCIPSGMVYDGCAFTVNIPEDLSTEDIGWDVWFTPVSGQAGWVSIHARKMPGISLESAFEQAAFLYGKQPLEAPSVGSVTVRDFIDQPLPGLQADLIIEGDHIRLLVVLRKETLLGDLSPQDVIYEITAQAPSESWNQLEPAIDVIFQSFRPFDCGGI